MFKYRCTNGGKQHNFQPRYTIKNMVGMKDLEGPLSELRALIKALADKTYNGDVCEWCGKIINEPKN